MGDTKFLEGLVSTGAVGLIAGVLLKFTLGHMARMYDDAKKEREAYDKRLETMTNEITTAIGELKALQAQSHIDGRCKFDESKK